MTSLKHLDIKKLILMAIIVTAVSCGNKNTKFVEQKSYYSNETDTIYKSNSLEIDRIDRVFFKIIGGEPKEIKLNDNRESELSVVNEIGSEKIQIVISNTTNGLLSGFGVARFKNTQQFESFLGDLDILINNPTKSLNYTINHNDKFKFQGSLSNHLDGNVDILIDGYGDEYGTFNLEKKDIESLKGAYQKYKIELNTSN